MSAQCLPESPSTCLHVTKDRAGQGHGGDQENMLQTGCQTPGHLPILRDALRLFLTASELCVAQVSTLGWIQEDKGKEKLCQPPGRDYC